MKCPTCGTGSLVAAVRDVPYSYKGRKTLIRSVKGKFCDNPACSEVVMGKEEWARTSKEMREFSRKAAIGK